MAERELGAPPEPTITIGVPLRRWVPIALAAAFVLDSWKPVAVGNAAWVSTLSWISVSLVVTWYRVRRISVELTDSSLIISSPSHRPPLAIQVGDIQSLAPVKSGWKWEIIVRTDDGALIALPTPLSTWWMWQGDGHFASKSEQVQRWFVSRREASQRTV